MATKAPAGSEQILRKEQVVSEIKERLDSADAAVLTEYRGLTVAQIGDLRASLREAGTEYKVFKNTLARRAAVESGNDDLLEYLDGPVGIAFVSGDAVPAAKALTSFAADVEAFVVKGGVLSGRVLGPDEITELSKVAPREELLARLAGGFKAPMARAAGAFSGLQSKMARLVAAYVDQRVAAGESAEASPEPEPEAEAEAEALTETDEPATEEPAAEAATDQAEAAPESEETASEADAPESDETEDKAPEAEADDTAGDEDDS